MATSSSLYPSEIFGVNQSTNEDIRNLFRHLRDELAPMEKDGPMSGRCGAQTNQMEEFLRQNFGFKNILGQYIVPGVRAFQLERDPSSMDDTQIIYFPKKNDITFAMNVSEIKSWQKSFVVYADKDIGGMSKEFLQRALQGQSEDGPEAFRMKFVVRISTCPILMEFDAKILSRSIDEDPWPHLIKLVSVTGIDFAGRKHDVDDITTYIKNWQKVFELDSHTDKPLVYGGRDFHPKIDAPQAKLNETRLTDDLIRMVRLRLKACDKEQVQIVVETGIGLGVFAGTHIGIDATVRKLSAHAIRYVLEKDGPKYKNIQAVVLALPIFSKNAPKGDRLPNTFDYFVSEFKAKKYCSPIPVLIADQDMHRLTVAIAHRRFKVSQLNPADSHGVFGEYWQNRGPAVEEKLALTTLGLFVQHHLINPCVLNQNHYHLISAKDSDTTTDHVEYSNSNNVASSV